MSCLPFRTNNARMEADEQLGAGATISSVLYANLNHPDLKTQFPSEPSSRSSPWSSLPAVPAFFPAP